MYSRINLRQVMLCEIFMFVWKHNLVLESRSSEVIMRKNLRYKIST